MPDFTIIIAAIIIIGFIIGIRLMQRPETALWGNRLGALSMFLIILLVLYEEGTLSDYSTWLVILFGGILGIIMGQLVKMIQMPQMVALLNGFGGGASAIVAASTVLMYTEGINTETDLFVSRFTGLLALALGTLTFVGSMIAALKLQGRINQKPVLLSGHRFYQAFLLLAGVFLIVAGLYMPQDVYLYLLLLLTLIFTIYGILMTIRVGGADMPIIISFFNSLSGVATAICGMAVENLVLVGVGSLVGVAGLILTQIMCRAMNRSLASVLGGLKSSVSFKADDLIADQDEEAQEEEEPEEQLTPEEKIAAMAKDLKKVIIVPGYGMALAQAQHQVAELIQTLERQGKEIKIGIHPVAGRMPGHMHVLLAEVGVPYEQLFDMEVINPEFKEADLVIIVGACDVVNPAANTAEGTPIYGMPVLEVNQAKNIIVCNLNEKPGYSGVDNTLYQEKKVITIWGNAAETVPQVTSLLRTEG